MPELPDKAGKQVLSAEGSSNTAISVSFWFSTVFVNSQGKEGDYAQKTVLCFLFILDTE